MTLRDATTREEALAMTPREEGAAVTPRDMTTREEALP